jgi:hypothetical protein
VFIFFDVTKNVLRGAGYVHNTYSLTFPPCFNTFEIACRFHSSGKTISCDHTAIAAEGIEKLHEEANAHGHLFEVDRGLDMDLDDSDDGAFSGGVSVNHSDEEMEEEDEEEEEGGAGKAASTCTEKQKMGNRKSKAHLYNEYNGLTSEKSCKEAACVQCKCNVAARTETGGSACNCSVLRKRCSFWEAIQEHRQIASTMTMAKRTQTHLNAVSACAKYSDGVGGRGGALVAFDWRVLGSPVCRVVFSAWHGFSSHQLSKLISRVRAGDNGEKIRLGCGGKMKASAAPQTMSSCYPGPNTTNRKEPEVSVKVSRKREMCRAWQYVYASTYGMDEDDGDTAAGVANAATGGNADVAPHLICATPITNILTMYVLPYMTMNAWHNEYVSGCEETVSLSCFKTAFKQDNPNIRFREKNDGFSPCTACMYFDTCLQRQSLHGEERDKTIEMKKAHLLDQRRERMEYYKDMMRAAQSGCMSVIGDGMDMKKTPCPRWPGNKEMKGVTCLEQKVVGWSFNGKGKIFFQVMPWVAGGGDVTVETFRLAMNIAHREGWLILNMPLFLQLDNASDNKCQAMMRMADYLVAHQLICEVNLCFLLVGHTHENVDQYFHLIECVAKSYKSAIVTIPQWAEIIKRAFFSSSSTLPVHVEQVNAVPAFTACVTKEVLPGYQGHGTPEDFLTKEQFCLLEHSVLNDNNGQALSFVESCPHILRFSRPPPGECVERNGTIIPRFHYKYRRADHNELWKPCKVSETDSGDFQRNEAGQKLTLPEGCQWLKYHRDRQACPDLRHELQWKARAEWRSQSFIDSLDKPVINAQLDLPAQAQPDPESAEGVWLHGEQYTTVTGYLKAFVDAYDVDQEGIPDWTWPDLLNSAPVAIVPAPVRTAQMLNIAALIRDQGECITGGAGMISKAARKTHQVRTRKEMHQAEAPCEICNTRDGSPANPLVFCDGWSQNITAKGAASHKCNKVYHVKCLSEEGDLEGTRLMIDDDSKAWPCPLCITAMAKVNCYDPYKCTDVRNGRDANRDYFGGVPTLAPNTVWFHFAYRHFSNDKSEQTDWVKRADIFKKADPASQWYRTLVKLAGFHTQLETNKV